MTLSLERILDEADFEALEPVWNALLERSGSDIPFLRHEWIRLWWRSFRRDADEFGGPKKLLVLLVRDGTELVGIAPLMRCERGFLGTRLRVVSNIVNHHSFRSGLIAAERTEQVAEAVLRHLVDHESWDLLQYSYLLEESADHRALRDAARRLGLLAATKPLSRSPYLAIDSDWDAYFGAKTSKTRSDVTRKLRRLDKIGEVEVTRFTDAATDGALEQVFAVDARGWQHLQGTGLACSPSTETFYRTLADEASARGWMRGHLLALAGRPIAYEYNLVYKGVLYNLKIGHDMEHRGHGPGIALKYHVLRDAFALGLGEFDFLGWADDFKRVWCSGVREHVDLYACHPGTLRGLLYHAYEFRLKPYLRRFASLRRAKRRLGRGA